MAAERPSAWASILRSALLLTPFLVMTLTALGFILQDTVSSGVTAGRIVGLVLVGFVALLLAFQVTQSLRDLFAEPVETTGLVERRWSRSDLFLFRNDYLFVQRDVFRVRPEDVLEVHLGDTVKIRHYPHTSAVAAVEVISRATNVERSDSG